MKQPRLSLLVELLILALVSLISFSGCQHTPKAGSFTEAPAASMTEADLKALARLQQFEVSGKLAFKQGDKGGNAKFTWAQKGQDYALRLLNPFGGEEALMVFAKNEPRLKFPNEDWVSGEDLTRVFEAHVGWMLPFKYMTYWIKGMPVPKMPYQFSATEHGYRIIQGTWIIDCESLQTYQGLKVPGRMVFQHKEDNRRLKLVLQWS